MLLSTFTAFSHWNKFGHFVEGNVEVGQRRPGFRLAIHVSFGAVGNLYTVCVVPGGTGQPETA